MYICICINVVLLCTIQLDAALHQLLRSGGCPDEVNVLVGVHSSCTSRHPVQRTIARLGVLAILSVVEIKMATEYLLLHVQPFLR